jgi:hypothetical protein
MPGGKSFPSWDNSPSSSGADEASGRGAARGPSPRKKKIVLERMVTTVKDTTADPRAPEPGAEPQPGEKEFLDANQHVPDNITDDNLNEFAQPKPAGTVTAAPAAQTWTAEEVASYFAGVFLVMSFPLTRPLIGFGGEHWNVPDDKCQHLGRAWLPIFIKHIPYDRKPGMFADLVMWLPALGAVKSVCTEPIKEEIRLRREEKLRTLQTTQRMNPAAARPAPRVDDGQPPRSMTAPSMTANMATATSPA